MSRVALQHRGPYWSTEDPDGMGEDRYVWTGFMRIVSARRARKLRKRGVPLVPLHRVRDLSGGQHRPGRVEPVSPGQPGKHTARYAWFTEGHQS